MAVSFHPEAAKRFDQTGVELRALICEVSEPKDEPKKDYHLFTPMKFGPENIIGPIRFFYSVKDHAGNEVGRIWKNGNRSFGLLDTAYQRAQELATSLGKTPDLRNRTSVAFVFDTVCEWLKDSQLKLSLTEHVAAVCEAAIMEQEVWIPLYRTYCSFQFSIGSVTFKSISEKMMDEFFPPERVGSQPELARQNLNRHRSELQGQLAACVKLTAEDTTAQHLARVAAGEAIALLRFLCPVNWMPGIRSYCLPLGRERIEIGTELLVRQGHLHNINKSSLECGPTAWDLDEAIRHCDEALANLHDLASNTKGDYRRRLLDALLLYSRNSVTENTADKLVFVLVALETMLLKNASEPIVKNVGERMAFLIGDTLDARKAVVANIDQTYQLRSAFIHHGESVADLETVGRFLGYAWETFRRLLKRIDRHGTQASLIQELDDRKLT